MGIPLKKGQKVKLKFVSCFVGGPADGANVDPQKLTVGFEMPLLLVANPDSNKLYLYEIEEDDWEDPPEQADTNYKVIEPIDQPESIEFFVRYHHMKTLKLDKFSEWLKQQ